MTVRLAKHGFRQVVLLDRASPKGDGMRRVKRKMTAQVPDKEDRLTFAWEIHTEQGAFVFQAGPLVRNHEAIESLRRSSFWDDKTVDGIPWIGWDLGGHHRERSSEWDYYNESCVHLDDDPCYFDGGTALGAEDLLTAWVASGLDEELIWDSMEVRYWAWFSPK